MQQHLQWWHDLAHVSLHGCAESSPVVLVTVVRADGSTPREVGATMLLGLRDDQVYQSDTIGGGHLEFQAFDIAQAMLKGTDKRTLFVERFNLSARLGQCCGGVMWLLFEKLQSREHASMLASAYATWRSGQPIERQIHENGYSKWQVTPTQVSSTAIFETGETGWRWQQCVQPYAMKVLLFGAGHVGEAIVRCLQPIGVQVTWVDSRDNIFPPDLLKQVNCVCTDVPEAEIARFDPQGAILILTHDHQQDLQLCMEALKSSQSRFAYVGMIGSKSKRAIFEKRMQARGYEQTQLQRLVCPIGITGISSKQPAIIAVSVVAELLQIFDQKK
ncbi:xanthine dehydrogenase accessory protein XdhC [Acinetobacter soli]|uniref:xanthine dehydrogenase accessory protein XdhC n=1 Tax=Acinetobacter soli TaxID=487316 RepID=UPI0031B9EAE1